MNYICVNDNVVLYRKGLGIWRGKIIDFYKYRTINVKVQFYNDIILTFPIDKLIRFDSFWCIN